MDYNLSNSINNAIKTYGLTDGSTLSFGTIIRYLSDNYGLTDRTEEECVLALGEMLEEWLCQDYIKVTLTYGEQRL